MFSKGIVDDGGLRLRGGSFRISTLVGTYVIVLKVINFKIFTELCR